MSDTIEKGDICVGRVNGTAEWYVNGIVVAGGPGTLALESGMTKTTRGKARAIQVGYRLAAGDSRVWLFDGRPQTTCIAAPKPLG